MGRMSCPYMCSYMAPVARWVCWRGVVCAFFGSFPLFAFQFPPESRMMNMDRQKLLGADSLRKDTRYRTISRCRIWRSQKFGVYCNNCMVSIKWSNVIVESLTGRKTYIESKINLEIWKMVLFLLLIVVLFNAVVVICILVAVSSLLASSLSGKIRSKFVRAQNS